MASAAAGAHGRAAAGAGPTRGGEVDLPSARLLNFQSLGDPRRRGP